MSNCKDKERQIMRAAEHLFTSRHFHEITMDDVCETAGVGKGTIYRYFKDKEDLFHRVAMSGFQDLCELIGKATANGQNIEERLKVTLTQIHGFFIRRRQMFRMMQSESSRIPFVRGAERSHWQDRQRQLASIIAEILEEGVQTGELRNDIPPKTAAMLLLGMIRGSVWQLQETTESADLIPPLLDLFMRGAANPQPVARGKR